MHSLLSLILGYTNDNGQILALHAPENTEINSQINLKLMI